MPPPLCTPHATAQLQPIHALRLACGAQRALLPLAVGAMNIHDIRDRRQTDRRQTASLLNAPAYAWRRLNNATQVTVNVITHLDIT